MTNNLKEIQGWLFDATAHLKAAENHIKCVHSNMPMKFDIQISLIKMAEHRSTELIELVDNLREQVKCYMKQQRPFIEEAVCAIEEGDGIDNVNVGRLTQLYVTCFGENPHSGVDLVEELREFSAGWRLGERLTND